MFVGKQNSQLCYSVSSIPLVVIKNDHPPINQFTFEDNTLQIPLNKARANFLFVFNQKIDTYNLIEMTVDETLFSI